jgi:PmbA protein
MDIVKIGQEVLAIIKNDHPEVKGEVYLHYSKHTSINVLGQKIEEVKTSIDQGLGVRIVKDNKLGFAYTSDLKAEILKNCIAKALANCSENTEDKNWDISSKQSEFNQEELNIYDPALENMAMAEKIEIALEMEKVALAHDKRVTKTESAAYFDDIGKTYLCNTVGFEGSYRSTSCGGMVDVIAEDNGNMESGSGMDFKVHLKDFDPQKVGVEAASQACKMLGAKAPKTGTTNLIFSQEVSINFLSVMARLFLASCTQKGKSFLADKMDQKIAPNELTIIDDGLMPGLVGTAPFDDEGTAAQKKELVKDGVLTAFLHNVYTANKGDTVSTGNGQRGGFSSLPEVSPTNLYIEPGSKDPQELIKEAGNGIYVEKVMGMHTANPISGDFSLGIAGINIEDGELKGPVRGGAIAGNLKDLLMSIKGIGSDLKFLPYGGNIGAPTLLISNISVSGE